MVQLADGDIKTREVLDWKGVHLFHFMGSSCSQKARIFLNLKGIPWESHLDQLRLRIFFFQHRHDVVAFDMDRAVQNQTGQQTPGIDAEIARAEIFVAAKGDSRSLAFS